MPQLSDRKSPIILWHTLRDIILPGKSNLLLPFLYTALCVGPAVQPVVNNDDDDGGKSITSRGE